MKLRFKTFLANSWIAPWTAFFIGALLFYCRAWSAGFVADDFYWLGQVSFAKSISYFSGTWGYGNEYRPLVPLSYSLEASLGGNSPVLFHLTNTLLHIGNALLLFLLARGAGFSAQVGFLSALIFVLNPVTHEAVVWISGRDIVMSTFFVLSSLWTFKRSLDQDSLRWYLASIVLFVAALMTYEGATVFPFLLTIYLLCQPRGDKAIRFALPYFGLLAFYAAFWIVLFEGQITRFPVQESFLGAMENFWTLIKRVFHGSTHALPAIYYGLLTLIFLRKRDRRTHWGILMLMILTAYVPFFIVRGYADRFAYLASAPAAVLLAHMVVTVSEKLRRATAVTAGLALVLLVFYSVRMQERITEWKQAGELADGIVASVKRLKPSPPRGSIFIIEGVPDMHESAYVFITGLQFAIQRLYPSTPLSVVRDRRDVGPSTDRPTFFFKYDGQEVRALDQ